MSIIRAVAIAALMSGLAMGPALAKVDSALQAQAKVSQKDAQAAALKARPGKVKEWELEKEAGGSGLRYSFDIISSGKAYEVGVDAKDGAILENQLESKSPD